MNVSERLRRKAGRRRVWPLALAVALAIEGVVAIGTTAPAFAVAPTGCQFANTTAGAPPGSAMDPLRLAAGGSYINFYKASDGTPYIQAFITVANLKATPDQNIPSGAASVSWGTRFTVGTYALQDSAASPFWRGFLRATALPDGSITYEAGQLVGGAVEVNDPAAPAGGSYTPGANGVIEIHTIANQLGISPDVASTDAAPTYPSYVTLMRAETSMDATVGVGTTPATTVVDRAPAAYDSQREALVKPDATVCRATGGPVTASAIQADSFVDTAGVNTHLGQNTPGPYTPIVPNSNDVPGTNPPALHAQIEAKLVELGVRHIRDMAPDQPGGGFYDTNTLAALYGRLAGQNVKLDAVVPPGDDRGASDSLYGGGSTGLATRLTDWLEKLAKQGVLDAIEGVNEPDLGNADAATADNIQRDIKAFRDASPCTNGNPGTACPGAPTTPISIFGSSFVSKAGVVGEHAHNPSYGSLVDFANYHTYSPFLTGRPHRDFLLDYWGHLQSDIYAGKPAVVTELGWGNEMPPAQGNVDERASGSYIPKGLLINAQRGVPRTYIYSLLDDFAAPVPPVPGGAVTVPKHDNTYGLLRSDFSHKPAFDNVKNLLTLLKDPGPSFTPGTLSYTLAGEHLDQLLLQKRDGSFWLALWQNSELFDHHYATGNRPGYGPLSPPAESATITLPSALAATTYRISSGTAPVGSGASATSHTVSVPADDVVLVKLG
jgi:hypothetical protein